MVKFNNAGIAVWKKNFGGSGTDNYRFVTALPDGLMAAGYSEENSFGTGDWAGVQGKGAEDAMMVKHDHAGDAVWKKHFGGSGKDYYYSFTASSGSIVAVGNATEASFGTGDWTGVEGHGGQDFVEDAIIVKYGATGNIAGNVRNQDGTPANCPYLVLYRKTGDAEFSYYGLAPTDYGSYMFTDVETGDYILVAKPSCFIEYPDFIKYPFIPTYYGNTVEWTESTVISPIENATLQGIDITVFPVSIIEGSSSISGYVGEEEGSKSALQSGVSNPVKDVSVYLQQYTGAWSSIECTFSGEDGYFEFLNLTVGTYRVVLDIPGLKMLSYRVMEITEDGTVINDLEFEITEDGIITIGGETSITNIINPSLLAYPNPTGGQLRIINH